MGKFNIGDRVSLPEGTRGPPVEWLGRTGMILELVTTSSGSERLGQEYEHEVSNFQAASSRSGHNES